MLKCPITSGWHALHHKIQNNLKTSNMHCSGLLYNNTQHQMGLKDTSVSKVPIIISSVSPCHYTACKSPKPIWSSFTLHFSEAYGVPGIFNCLPAYQDTVLKQYLFFYSFPDYSETQEGEVIFRQKTLTDLTGHQSFFIYCCLVCPFPATIYLLKGNWSI